MSNRGQNLNIIRIFNARDCLVQPQGWDGAVGSTLALMTATAAWCCPAIAHCHNPVGVEFCSLHLPRVARSSAFAWLRRDESQPWALMRNPFGIGFRNGTI